MKKPFTIFALVLSLASLATGLRVSTASAQDWSDPEGGEEGQSTWGEGGQPGSAPAATPPAATPPAAAKKVDSGTPANWGVADSDAAAESAPTGTSDHSKHAVGHIGLGYFGALSIPSGFGAFDYTTASATSLPKPTSTTSPMLGMRMWFSDLVGLEAAVAFGFGSSSGEAGSSFDIGSNLALGVHAGLPLAVFHASHIKFLVIPEVNFGFASGSRTSTTPAAGAGDQEDLLSGMLFQVGAKAGAEMHFGFIGMPEFALQTAIGLYFNLASNTVDACTDAMCDTNVEYTQSTTSIGTQLSNDPVDTIAASLTAIYYF
jgi:hypothetical protein